MARKQFTTPEPTIVYSSPEGRVTVTRYAPDDFGLALDGDTVNSYPTQAAAEVAGGLWLHEQAAQLAPAAPEPEPWQCTVCVETNPAERDPERPHLCRSCPETWCQVETTRRQIVVVRYRDGVEDGRSFFQRSDAGRAAAERRLAREAAQGYPLRVESAPEPERCASCGSAGTMVSPSNGRIYCLACGQLWRFAPVAADPEELEGPQEEGGEGGPNTGADDFAAQVAHAERIAAAHQLGSGPAVWWERPYLFDIDAAGARADHLVPMLLSWRAA